MLEGELIDNRVIVWGEEGLKLYDESGYGNPLEDRVELALVEAVYLLSKKKLKVNHSVEGKKKPIDFEDFLKIATELEPEFHQKFVVYSDLRERGYLVKTGFKFGTHFRCYERGVKLKRGPKEAHEHTKWCIHAIREEDRFSYPELSRSVRLAQNIRAKMLWAVVDSEGDVTYYQITRLTP